MTKIINTDILKHTSDSIQVNSMDLAKRFEWRLNWEKSQLEQQTQKTPENKVLDGNQNRIVRSGASAVDRQSLRFQDTVVQLGKQVDIKPFAAAEVQQLEIASQQQTVREGAQLNKLFNIGDVQARPLSVKLAVPGAPESIQRFVRPQPKADTRPAIHIYENEGEIEVSLRQSGASTPRGLEILAELRRPLRALGLNLARLTVNGDLIWQKKINIKPAETASQADSDRLIDRNY